MLRDASYLRQAEQRPTPLEAGLLQQLPTAETVTPARWHRDACCLQPHLLQPAAPCAQVTPANWPEMLRAVGLLLREMEPEAGAPGAGASGAAANGSAKPSPMAAAVRALERGGYGALNLAGRLLLLRALCDKAGSTASLAEVIKANATADLELQVSLVSPLVIPPRAP